MCCGMPQHPVVESLWRTNASTIVQDEMEDLRKRFLPTKQLPPRRGVKRRVQEI